LKKRYGQHFLSDRNILQRIVRLSSIAPTDTVVEIGPGAGTLTRELAGVAHRVIAIEIDGDLIPKLRSDMPQMLRSSKRMPSKRISQNSQDNVFTLSAISPTTWRHPC
jgi:16S rRNA A1518/A1519 N6-dimethyltransferase RsmA/KsgA/DIM1 with predicted DNA glycosylase/AP lyase activity